MGGLQPALHADRAEITAEPMPRRRRGGMESETLAGVSPRQAGRAIALCGPLRFVSRQADRRQKAIVCPTGLDAGSTSCVWVSGERQSVARESLHLRRHLLDPAVLVAASPRQEPL